MMKRIVTTLFFLSLILMALAAIAPGFINWNAHKDKIVAQIQPHIGRKIEVAGDAGFRILPNPEITLGDVTFANIEGGKAPYFMKLRQMEAKIRLRPLLEGKIEIESLNLAEPDVNIEMLPNGEGNWTGVFKEKPDVGNLASAKIDQVSLSQGTLHYINQATGSEWIIEDLRLDVRGDSLFGPYVATGGMKYRDYPVNLEISVGRYQAGQPVPLNASFLPVEGLPQVKLSGTADLSAGFSLQADLSVERGTISSLFDSKSLQSLSFARDIATVNAALSIKDNVISLDNIKASFGGQARVSGDMTFTLARGKKPSVAATLSGENIALSGQSEFIEPPLRFDGVFNLTGKSVIFGGSALKTVTAAVEAKEGAWVVKNAKAVFGAMDMDAFRSLVSDVPETGFADFSIVSGETNFRDFEAVFKTPTLAVPGVKTSGLSALVAEAPVDFPAAFAKEIRGQEMLSFRDVTVSVSRKDGKLAFKDMVIANDDVKLTAKGSYQDGKFDISAVGELKKPEEAPSFGVTGFPDYKLDTKALEKFVAETRKEKEKAVKEAEEKAAAAKVEEEKKAAEEALPSADEPTQTEAPPEEAIKGILDRLDTPEESAVETPPQPEPAAEEPAAAEKGLPELLEDAQMLPPE